MKEWVDYHKNKGFETFFIYSNGESLYNIPETFEFDIRGKEAQQLLVYQDAYSKIGAGDTLTVLDDDEYLTMDCSIEELWRQFPVADCLRFSWQVMTDNGLTQADPNKTIVEQFTEAAPVDCVYNKDLPDGITENFHTKYSIRKTWKQTRLGIHNPLIMNGISINMLGNFVDGTKPWMKPVWETAFVRHYLTQDTETFCKRRFNVKDACGNVVADTNKLIDRYYTLNKRTQEKDDVFKRYSENIPGVPVLGDSSGVQQMGETTGPESDSGKVTTNDETISKRAGARKK